MRIRTLSLVIVILAIGIVSTVTAPARAITPSYDPNYRGDPNSVHAVFDWAGSTAPWTLTTFETGQSAYPLADVQASATDDGLDTTIELPNFIDPLSTKLMRIQLSFDGPVAGDLLSVEVEAFDPETTIVNILGGSSGLDLVHYIDVEIFPNPDWERIIIFGNDVANIVPGNLLAVEIDTVSLPEPATLGVLTLGLISTLLKRKRSI